MMLRTKKMIQLPTENKLHGGEEEHNVAVSFCPYKANWLSCFSNFLAVYQLVKHHLPTEDLLSKPNPNRGMSQLSESLISQING